MKLKITFLTLVIASLFCLLAATGSTGGEDGKKLVIAYTNNVEGYLEPCG